VAEAGGVAAFGGEDRAAPVVIEGEVRAEDADTVDFAVTEPLPDIPASSASGITEEVKARPGIGVPPEPATAAPAGWALIPARLPAEQRPGRLTRQDEEAASPEKATAPRGNVQASPAGISRTGQFDLSIGEDGSVRIHFTPTGELATDLRPGA
jgi:hypothetical protein